MMCKIFSQSVVNLYVLGLSSFTVQNKTKFHRLFYLFPFVYSAFVIFEGDLFLLQSTDQLIKTMLINIYAPH